MNRIRTTLGASLIATSLMSGAAFAADKPVVDPNDKTRSAQQTAQQTNKPSNATNKADNTQVAPSREDLKPGAEPTVQRMDDNAQRQHDRNNRSGSATAAGGSAAGAAAQGGVAASDVRDWDAIDKNNDNLVGPEEMEAWLKQAGPQAKPQPKS